MFGWDWVVGKFRIGEEGMLGVVGSLEGRGRGNLVMEKVFSV